MIEKILNMRNQVAQKKANEKIARKREEFIGGGGK